MTRHRLRRTLQGFAQSLSHDERTRACFYFETIARAKIVRPDERIAACFYEVRIETRKLMNVKLAHYLLKLLRLNVQALAPDINRRATILVLRGFIKNSNQRTARGDLRRNLF